MTQWGLDTLFNPAKRHMDEEKRRLQSTREEVGDNSGGRRVDFDSGKVKIRRDESDGTENAEATETAAGKDAKSRRRAAKSGKTEKSGAKVEKTAKEPTEAQIRAAKRRGREL